MQQGSIIQAERKIGPDVWEFRWREPGPDGKRRHRRMVIGRIDQLVDESAARERVAALHLDINFWDARVKGKPLTISELAEHYRQRELKPDTVWKTYSTKLTYEGYLSNGYCLAGEITSLRVSMPEKLNYGCDPCLLLVPAVPRQEIS